MRHGLNNEAWKSLLPDSAEWLERVVLNGGAATVLGAHHVVAVKADDNDKDQFKLSATKVPADLNTKILDTARGLGWRPSAGALHLKVDGSGYTLVPLSAVRAPAPQVARQLGIDAAKATKDLKIGQLAFCSAEGLSGLDVVEGYLSGQYGAGGFKGQRKPEPGRFPATLTLAGENPSADAVTTVLEMAKAQAFSRFLQDAPANYLTPAKLADIAKDMAQAGGLACKILDKEQMTKLGMGSFLSVADGSVLEPRTIVIEIEGRDNSRSIALVGKGLTFDSGGISLKPGAGMEEMKYDMSGGAAVLGAAKFFAKVKPAVKVICVVGATENMPSGTATRPGDVVRAMNGKTIEVHNTDAEGRLVLADVLHYAITTHKPELVIDIATLTGAVLMALGCVGSALMSNDPATAQYLLKVAEGVGEPTWQLPLWPELDKEVKGDIADLKNIAKPSVKGGTIMGGIFLKEFVGNTKWAHLDIAGTGYNCQALGYPSSGGASFGLKTLVAACLRYGQ